MFQSDAVHIVISFFDYWKINYALFLLEMTCDYELKFANLLKRRSYWNFFSIYALLQKQKKKKIVDKGHMLH